MFADLKSVAQSEESVKFELLEVKRINAELESLIHKHQENLKLQ